MTSPVIENLARQLLARELASVESSHVDADHAVRACEKLRGPLTKLAGAAGFASLLSRAVTLAKREAPALERLRVGADGTLGGCNELQGELDTADAARHGGVVLLAQMLGLLVTLIGEPLMLSLVREAWPDAASPKKERKP
jgi:hypothetical protein